MGDLGEYPLALATGILCIDVDQHKNKERDKYDSYGPSCSTFGKQLTLWGVVTENHISLVQLPQTNTPADISLRPGSTEKEES